MTTTRRRSNRFYVKDSIVPFEEDAYHEFKGHRNLSAEEVPGWCLIPGTGRMSRKAVSRNINGFLNTGKGGTIYLGIIDEGKVKGITLSKYQKDHVIVSMKDLMNRYTPQVPEDRYKSGKIPTANCMLTAAGADPDQFAKIEIVPVIQKTDMWKDVTSQPTKEKSQTIDANRLKPHLLRTSDYCWCDKDALEDFSKGIISGDYIIEITILPYPHPPLTMEDGSYHINLHPVYLDEEGSCYFRRQASMVKYTTQEVVDLTIHEIQGHFMPILESLKQEVNSLKEML